MNVQQKCRPCAWAVVVYIASLPAGAASLPAGAPSQSVDAVLACRDVQDPANRLACFDRETGKLQAGASGPASAPSVEVTPSARASRSALPPLSAPQQFGLSEGTLASREVAAGARPAALAKISARLAKFDLGSDGRLVFTLDNEQVWKQIATEGELLPRQGDALTISRGWLNSYYLQLENGRGCKVRRVK